jgi:O-antigen/teichoic acid export membrane protein
VRRRAHAGAIAASCAPPAAGASLLRVPVVTRQDSAAAGIQPLLSRARRIVRGWSGPTALALLDQGTSSGANFVLQIVLARHLSPDAYGAFNVAYAVYLMFLTVPNLVLFEPMVVLGQRHTGRGLDAYAARLFRAHAALSLLLALGLAASRLLYPAGGAVADASLWFAASAPFLMGFQFLRRACYLRSDPGAAFAGSATYAAVLLGFLWVWHETRFVQGAIALMGASALAGGAVMFASRGWWSAFARRPAWSAAVWDDVAACWRSGKWLLASGLVGWAAGAAHVPLAAGVAGLGAAGAVRAVENLYQPVSHGLTALAALASPWLARRARVRGAAFVRVRMWALGVVAAAGVAVYALAMWGAGAGMMRWLYGPATAYAIYAPLIPILGIVYVVRGVADVGLGTGLRALGNWRVGLTATACGAAVMLASVVPLARSRGVAGLLLAMVLAGLAQLAVLARASLVSRPAPRGVSA